MVLATASFLQPKRDYKEMKKEQRRQVASSEILNKQSQKIPHVLFLFYLFKIQPVI